MTTNGTGLYAKAMPEGFPEKRWLAMVLHQAKTPSIS